MDTNKLWDDVKTTLNGQMTQATYDANLAGSRLLSARDGSYTVEVNSENAADWLEHRLKSKVCDVLASVTDQPVNDIVFVVDWQDDQPEKLPDYTATLQVNGFTMIFDEVAQELGLTTAIVYGLVYRHCQMRDRVCRASNQSLAELAGMTRETINRHLKKLCKAKYIIDLTPEVKHRPHIYKDAGKVELNLTARKKQV